VTKFLAQVRLQVKFAFEIRPFVSVLKLFAKLPRLVDKETRQIHIFKQGYGLWFSFVAFWIPVSLLQYGIPVCDYERNECIDFSSIYFKSYQSKPVFRKSSL